MEPSTKTPGKSWSGSIASSSPGGLGVRQVVVLTTRSGWSAKAADPLDLAALPGTRCRSDRCSTRRARPGGQHGHAEPAQGEGVALDQARVADAGGADRGEAAQGSQEEVIGTSSQIAVAGAWNWGHDRAGLKATVQSDLHDAMRARDKVRSGALRMALTSITNEEVAGKEARRLSDDEVLKVLAKEAKRKEAATAYRDAGHPDRAEAEEAELAVLEAYLPAQLDDAELEALVAQAVTETGATGMPQMGQVMKAAQALVAGRADGGRMPRR